MQHQHVQEDQARLPTDGSPGDAVTPDAGRRSGGPLAAWWNAVTAVIATVMGLAPHVLHHIGLFAGAAFVVGTGGNLLFGLVGLLMSVPLLRRLHRRFGTWKAPAIAVAVFTVMFSVSAFVVGPAISGADRVDEPLPAEISDDSEHDTHHDE